MKYDDPVVDTSKRTVRFVDEVYRLDPEEGRNDKFGVHFQGRRVGGAAYVTADSVFVDESDGTVSEAVLRAVATAYRGQLQVEGKWPPGTEAWTLKDGGATYQCSVQPADKADPPRWDILVQRTKPREPVMGGRIHVFHGSLTANVAGTHGEGAAEAMEAIKDRVADHFRPVVPPGVTRKQTKKQ